MNDRTKSGLKTHFLFKLLRSDRLISIVVFLITFICYELITPTRLSSANFGSDGGDYLTAVLTGGVPHPTGYPLYLVLSQIAQMLPLSSPVWKQTQISILSGALGSAAVSYLLLQFTNSTNRKDRLYFVMLSSLILPFSYLFWSQAVIVEVYSLHVFWIVLAIIWIERYSYPSKTIHKYELCTFSWICGLGLANHTTIALLYPIVAFCFIRLYQTIPEKKWFWLSAFGWFSGILLYIILPLRALQNPPIAWGNPSTQTGFFWLVTGGDYHQNLFAIQFSEYFQRLLATLNIFTKQFGFVGIILALIGIFQFEERPIFRWATVVIFFVYTFFALGYKTNDSMVYLLPAVVCLVIWVFWGLMFLNKISIYKINLATITSILLVVTFTLAIPGTINTIDPRDGDLANYAEPLLQNSPEGYILFPETDGETFALWYYQYGLGLRPDVKIISPGLLHYQWYQDSIHRLYPDYQIPDI
jgi:hypothetical protein